jgi:hypothetical protein
MTPLAAQPAEKGALQHTPSAHHLFVDAGVDEAALARVLVVLARA